MGAIRVIILGGDAFMTAGVKHIISCLAMPKNMFEVRNGGVIDCLTANRTDYQRTVVIGPRHLLNVISLFPNDISVIAACSRISVDEFVQLLSGRSISRVQMRLSYIPRLTKVERRYCLLLAQGVSVEQMAIIFHCGRKNISNIKAKVMTKWRCQNTLEFYKLLLTLLEII
ncbi:MULTISPECIES: helix-turn-helix transcriptional regulator [Gibbsiella]|uniref:HTH luxR-type domain-containing protein n=1 Tax=Gibbsiella dentisursi TaxID=796890 RepID=A0ABP7KME2_9GAMM|nr:hypothetical protein [Gibbsiella quercinecans]